MTNPIDSSAVRVTPFITAVQIPTIKEVYKAESREIGLTPARETDKIDPGNPLDGKAPNQPSLMPLPDELVEEIKKLGKLAAGEKVDPIDWTKKPANSKEILRNQIAAEMGVSPSQISDHNLDVAQNTLDKGGDLKSAAAAVQSDPLVFDLNHDGDTNATVDQHGINVDGATSTKWAEKGDGVLAFGDTPIGTEGGQYKDAMATLTAKAQEAGIDTSKGFLDKADLQLLESKGLKMMVSNGDGSNQSVPPTELGISQISLTGKAVNKTDIEGNSITTESSFVQNGQSHAMNDMWLNNIPVKQP
jgi:hypothetical protein